MCHLERRGKSVTAEADTRHRLVVHSQAGSGAEVSGAIDEAPAASAAAGVSVSGVFSGGEAAADSGVDQGGAGAVGPAGWDPFGEPVAVDATLPAAGGEVVVVVAA